MYPQQTPQPGYPQQPAPYPQFTPPPGYPTGPIPQQPPAAVTAVPELIDAPQMGGAKPRIADLDGRVIMMMPTKLEKDVEAPTRQGEPPRKQDRITYTLVVLDGGPLRFGGNPQRGQAHTLEVAVPYMTDGVFDSHVNIVASLVPHVGSNKFIMGKVGRGITNDPRNSPPWNLYSLSVDVNDRAHVTNAERQNKAPAQLAAENTAARQLCQNWLAAYVSGQFVNPTPQPIGAPNFSMSPPAAQPTPVPPYVPPPGYPTAAPAPTPYPYAPVPPAGYPPTPAPTPGYVPGSPYAPVPPAAAPAIPPPPPGFEPGVWAQLNDAQRAQILGQAPPDGQPRNPW